MDTVMDITDIRYNLNKYKGELFCFFLWISVCINEYIWLNINKYPQAWDPGLHFIESVRMYNTLNGGLLEFPNIILDANTYPPLVAFSGTPFYYFFGPSINIGTLGINCIYLGILIFSVYELGKSIKNVYAGLLAAIIIISLPLIGSYSKLFLLDVPLAALVALSLYFLLKTKIFSNRKFSIFFGISLGLGMLIKWTFALSLIGPLIFYIILGYLDNRTIRNNLIYNCKNLLFSIIVGGLIACIWYIPNATNIIFYLKSQAGVVAGPSNFFISFIQMTSLYFALLFLIALIYLFYCKKMDHKMYLLLISFITPFIILAVLSNHDYRYIAPILPAMAVIISIGIFSLQNTFIKRTVIFVSVIFSFVLFISISYGIVSIPFHNELGLGNSINIGQPEMIPFFTNWTRAPDTNNWQENEIYDTLLQDSGKNMVSIGVIPEIGDIITPLMYTAYLDNWTIHVYSSGGGNPYLFFNCAYVLTLEDKAGDWGPKDSRHIFETAMYSQDLFEKNRENFILIKTIPLPDNSDLLIYKKQMTVTNIRKISHPSNVTFSDKIEFLGYDMNKVEVNTTKELELLGRITNTYKITYYWKCIGPMDKNYTIFVHITDNEGNIIFQQDHSPIYGLYTTSKWIPGTIYEESYFVSPPKNLLGGNYSMGLGLYTLAGGELVPNNEQKDRYMVDRLPLGNYSVTDETNNMGNISSI